MEFHYVHYADRIQYTILLKLTHVNSFTFVEKNYVTIVEKRNSIDILEFHISNIISYWKSQNSAITGIHKLRNNALQEFDFLQLCNFKNMKFWKYLEYRIPEYEMPEIMDSWK